MKLAKRAHPWRATAVKRMTTKSVTRLAVAWCTLFGCSLGGGAFGWAKVFDLLAGLSLVLVLVNQRIWQNPGTAGAGSGLGSAECGAKCDRATPAAYRNIPAYFTLNALRHVSIIRPDCALGLRRALFLVTTACPV
ncbi:MAG TPA: hypothetical protein VNE82_05610 [Candidatus Binataceae bacterium]|nr:hypothetical protein [Candidatus Binataceae bacterium]